MDTKTEQRIAELEKENKQLAKQLEEAKSDLQEAHSQYRSQFEESRQITEILNETNIALAISEEKFKAVFENSFDAIGVAKKGVHVLCNPAYMKMFGFENEEDIIGKPIYCTIAERERENIKEYTLNRMQGTLAPKIYETIGLRNNGTEFPFEISVNSYEVNDEEYSVVIIRDITERKNAEEELLEAHKQYAAQVEEFLQLTEYLTQEEIKIPEKIGKK